MAKLALRVPWVVVVAALFISCTPATDEPSPTATPTATAAATATAMPAATATPIVTPTPVPTPATSDIWPEISLDATISPGCRAQIIAYAEFSGTLAEIAQQEAALVTVLGHQFSRLTDEQLGNIDSRIERLAYELEYQASWGYGVYLTPTPRPTPTPLPRGVTPTPTATPVAATPVVEFNCARDREALNQFSRVRGANPMGQFRQGVLEDYWRCAAYRDDPQPTPDVSRETYCRQGQAWWPESWLPNEHPPDASGEGGGGDSGSEAFGEEAAVVGELMSGARMESDSGSAYG